MAQPRDFTDAMAKAQLFEDRHDDILGKQRGEGQRTWAPQGKPGLPSLPKGYKPSGHSTIGAVIPSTTRGIQTGAPKFPSNDYPQQNSKRNEKGGCVLPAMKSSMWDIGARIEYCCCAETKMMGWTRKLQSHKRRN